MSPNESIHNTYIDVEPVSEGDRDSAPKPVRFILIMAKPTDD